MRKLILIFLIAAPAIIFSQTRYMIYFKDKAVPEGQKLLKSSEAYQEALNQLSPRAVERREKTMGDNIITYEDLSIKNDYLQNLKNYGIVIINKLNWFNAVSAYLTESQKAYLISQPYIKKVEKVRSFAFRNTESIMEAPQKVSAFDSSDYGTSYSQYALSGIPTVHSEGITGNGVIIGILDTGFRWHKHQSLINRKVLAEYDFVFHDSITANQYGDATGQDSHGTLVFSVIGGYEDGQIIGPAYNASYILAKTEDIRSESHIEEDNYAAALEWMEALGVDITTSSLGYNIFDDTTYSYSYSDMNGKTTIITKAADLAFNRGVVVMTAAGNEGTTSWHYIIAPADGFNVIAVGAVDKNNNIAGFSSRGPTADGRIKPDITADGVSVYGASVNGFTSYTFASGTSLSTPIAAGCTALLLSAYPYLKNTQIRSILLESSNNSRNPNNDIGYGLISAASAISYPNLQKINGSTFVLHKSFLDKQQVNSSTVQIHYFTNTADTLKNNLNFSGNWDYTFTLPSLPGNTIFNFYFTYEDNNGVTYRVPENSTYKINYGNLDVSLNIALQTYLANENISDLYPNPYLPMKSGNVRIKYKSPGNEILNIMIIDGSGRKVKGINITTDPGEHDVEWDGKNDRGEPVASGVYYFLINLNGQKYGKKLVLLK